MNLRKVILSGFLLLVAMKLFSQQHIEFTYDGNGNRITRTLVTQQLKSAIIKFPITDPKEIVQFEYLKRNW